MKNVFYITRSNLGAVPFPELGLPILARSGWNVVVAGVNSSRSMYRRHIPYACESIDLPDLRSRVAHESAVFSLLQRARFGKFSVIYIESQSMSSRAAIGLSGPRFGKRVVYYNRDYYCPVSHPWHARLEGRLCRMANLYMNAEFHRGYISSTMYRSRCPVITAPPNLPRAWPIPATSVETRAWMAGGDASAFVLMLHGGYGRFRRTAELMEALSLLPGRFRLVMTGRQRDNDTIDEIVKKLNIGNRVVRLPSLDFQEQLQYTVNADAGVLLYENNDLGNFFQSPGRLTEYLACGLPLLGVDHTGLANLVMRFNIGVSADATRPRAIANALLQLEAGKCRGQFPREGMRKLFEDYFAFDNWEDTILDAFNESLDGRPRDRNSNPGFPWLASDPPSASGLSGNLL